MFSKLNQFVQRLRGGAIELSLGPYEQLLPQIEQCESELQWLADDRLAGIALEIREQLSSGLKADKLLPRTFALVRQVAERVLSIRPHDEQMVAGIVLHQGKVVQMQTGEGKTLAAVAPAVLNGFSGQGVHILTFNDYLAQRDAAWMGSVFRFLGLTVGHVVQGMSSEDRRAAYACDVTYVTAQEAGFDFLRDQLVGTASELVQRGFAFAIVDEADSILIDEARVPLVIAGDVGEPPIDGRILADVVRQLVRDVHYEIGKRARNVNFTAAGLDHLERVFKCEDLHSEPLLPVLTRLNQALHAEHLLRRDIDYLVRDGKVCLLDELTGRVADDRRWPHGLQAAVEAKEGQPIQPDGRILNSITLQNFAALYSKLSGMTGTAELAAEELHDSYGLRVAVLATHQLSIRQDEADELYASRAAKGEALVRFVGQLHRSGQPVLVGTADVRESDQLGERLTAANIPCRVLNARNDHEEANIVADAGTFGAVTIATNMAGRGTDIRLGGHEERDVSRIKSLGGLCVVGTNRHESRRIDNQLRGRSGRQGDPGRSRFIISLEDNLLSRFGMAEAIDGVSIDRDSTEPVDDPRVTEKVAHIQRVVEGECFEIRRTLRRYSAVLELQRQEISARRRSFLLDPSPAYILPDAAAERYDDLVRRFGRVLVQQVERQIALIQIDRCWADHLEQTAEFRDSLHLFSLGGLDPFAEFQRHAGQAYRDLLKRIDDEIVAKFRAVEVTEHGIDLEKEDLVGPSSTWTYMINDHPAGDVFDRLSKSVKRLLSGG